MKSKEKMEIATNEEQDDMIELETEIEDIVVKGNYQYGDVNGDEKISNADVTKLRAYVLGKVGLTTKQKIAADVNGDGEITIEDCDLIRQYFLGKITKFPVEENL